MELYDEIKNENKSKSSKIIGICIVVLIILMILIMFAIVYLKSSIRTIQIDAKKKNELEEIIYVDETGSTPELYFPIIKMAKYLEYSGYSGDYKNKSEDKTKCYVTNEKKEEIAMFSKDSDILVKVTNELGIENIKLDKAVLDKDGELYTTIYGLQKAFNVSVYSDENFKNIDIFTMDYLITNYTKKLKIKQYSKDFSDKKAVLEGMLIKKENNQYGVVNIYKNGQAILEPKYEDIKFLPATSDFLVKSNGKYGVVAKDTTIKVKPLYDEIDVMDNIKGLYLVRKNNTYGVINTEGKVILEPEYKQIGINTEKYVENGIENRYILLEKIIPLKNDNGLWGLFNIETKQKTDFKYTDIGCEKTPVSNAYPVAIIPKHQLIIVRNDKYYNLVTLEGNELISGSVVDSVYLKINTQLEQHEFFMTSNEYTKIINIDEWLTSIGK